MSNFLASRREPIDFLKEHYVGSQLFQPPGDALQVDVAVESLAVADVPRDDEVAGDHRLIESGAGGRRRGRWRRWRHRRRRRSRCRA
ncbi:MAG: hypothetical protein U0575_13960 [Phycisphaerales bacterium]